jgi:hypothetical protein
MVARLRILALVSLMAAPCLAQTAPPAETAAERANRPAPATALPAIRVSANGRYFVKADGTPFFWLGDTAWCLFNHPSPQDVDLYLNDRQAKGFTVIQACVAVWDYRTRRNPDGELPFVDGDPGRVNEAYFKNVDAIVDKCTQRGLYLAILPFWTKNNINGQMATTVENPEKMKAYCAFLTKRYADKNIFWVLGGDAPGTNIVKLIDAQAEGLLAGAKEKGVDKIMITYHPTGRQSSSFWFHERSWLDFNAIQSGHFTNTTNFQLVGDDWEKQPVKPTLDMEPGYENITDGLNRNAGAARIMAVDVRRSAYLAVFAGAAGHTYGNGEVYEFWEAGRAPLPGWAANLPWKESLQLPASGQMQHLRYLMDSRPAARVPDQSLVVAPAPTMVQLPPPPPAAAAPGGAATGPAARGRGRGPRESALTRVAATRAEDGAYAFVYLPPGQPAVTVATGKLAGARLKSWWYDPRTGAATPIDVADRGAATATRAFTAPAGPAGKDDWVLVIEDEAKHFPAPGAH